MAPLTNHVSRLKLGRRWDDGFINQRLLGLGVAALGAGSLLGIKALVELLTAF